MIRGRGGWPKTPEEADECSEEAIFAKLDLVESYTQWKQKVLDGMPGDYEVILEKKEALFELAALEESNSNTKKASHNDEGDAAAIALDVFRKGPMEKVHVLLSGEMNNLRAALASHCKAKLTKSSAACADVAGGMLKGGSWHSDIRGQSLADLAASAHKNLLTVSVASKLKQTTAQLAKDPIWQRGFGEIWIPDMQTTTSPQYEAGKPRSLKISLSLLGNWRLGSVCGVLEVFLKIHFCCFMAKPEGSSLLWRGGGCRRRRTWTHSSSTQSTVCIATT